MEIAPYLKLMVAQGGSDRFFSVGARQNVKIEGETVPVRKHTLDSNTLKRFANDIMDDEQKLLFEEKLELNLGFTLEQISRFRGNLYRQRGEVAIVLRHIKDQVPSLGNLGTHPILGAARRLCSESHCCRHSNLHSARGSVTDTIATPRTVS